MKYAIAGLFTAVVLPAWAQTQLSECASQLASAGLAETGCSEGDYACACSSQAYEDALTSNVEQQCGPEDHAQVTAYLQELCAGDGAEEEDGDEGENEEEDGDAAMSTQYAATTSQYAAQPTGGAEYEEDGDEDYAATMSSQYAAQPTGGAEYEEEDGDEDYAATTMSTQYAAQPTGGAEYEEDGDEDYAATTMSSQYAAQPTAGAGYEEDDGEDYDDEYYPATSTMGAQPTYPAGNATTGYGYAGPTGTGSATGGPVEYTGGASVAKGSAWGGLLAAAGGLAIAAF
ncbi:hypothetical protein NU219Hw_g3856t1 [Hortaea werneckii]